MSLFSLSLSLPPLFWGSFQIRVYRLSLKVLFRRTHNPPRSHPRSATCSPNGDQLLKSFPNENDLIRNRSLGDEADKGVMMGLQPRRVNQSSKNPLLRHLPLNTVMSSRVTTHPLLFGQAFKNKVVPDLTKPLLSKATHLRQLMGRSGRTTMLWLHVKTWLNQNNEYSIDSLKNTLSSFSNSG